jgi:hypothetical protein
VPTCFPDVPNTFQWFRIVALIIAVAIAWPRTLSEYRSSQKKRTATKGRPEVWR